MDLFAYRRSATPMASIQNIEIPSPTRTTRTRPSAFSPRSSPVSQQSHRMEADYDLACHISRAIDDEEAAAHRDSMKGCTTYTWDHESSTRVWSTLKEALGSVPSSDIQVFKGLILTLIILQTGHPITMKEALQPDQMQMQLRTWIRADKCDVSTGYQAFSNALASFILAKLTLHQRHPLLNGLYHYNAFVSGHGAEDFDQQFVLLNDMMHLQEGIQSFASLLIRELEGKQFKSNKCVTSALAPLIKESVNIYLFMSRALGAAASRAGDRKFSEFRKRYRGQYDALKTFYSYCLSDEYLSTLVVLPKLPILMTGSTKGDQDPPPTTPSEAGSSISAAKLTITPLGRRGSPLSSPTSPATARRAAIVGDKLEAQAEKNRGIMRRQEEMITDLQNLNATLLSQILCRDKQIAELKKELSQRDRTLRDLQAEARDNAENLARGGRTLARPLPPTPTPPPLQSSLPGIGEQSTPDATIMQLRADVDRMMSLLSGGGPVQGLARSLPLRESMTPSLFRDSSPPPGYELEALPEVR
ncbi:hypothetical protein BOTBODRAFT_27184 [Botryobasidium botryosum FD-172 SS1]|uniref:ENTH domain-containing protein n=1 Tax=Botryobasidium botryosum (strain FD-172 SS1) TaxID=930990 RepID=A0A067MYI6_BOTB1|nr:hypothetical protein BOTBODRAFT_27184 [Botryobasidium botryosum FD-172 SS1]